jgi:hypothetical protein
MRQPALLLVVVLFLMIPDSGNGSPLKGKHAFAEEIEPGSRQRYQVEFRGGERACVIVRGKAELELSVYDATGNLIAKDDAGGNFASVIWYPPRNAVYRFEIRNLGDSPNECYISLK